MGILEYYILFKLVDAKISRNSETDKNEAEKSS